MVLYSPCLYNAQATCSLAELAVGGLLQKDLRYICIVTCDAWATIHTIYVLLNRFWHSFNCPFNYFHSATIDCHWIEIPLGPVCHNPLILILFAICPWVLFIRWTAGSFSLHRCAIYVLSLMTLCYTAEESHEYSHIFGYLSYFFFMTAGE